MYELNQVVNGITKYVDNEIITKISGWQKWVIGAGFGLSTSKATSIFNQIKSNPMVGTLGIIDEEDKIDVDTLMVELKKQAQKGAITFDVPLVGALTLKGEDLDKLHSYIRG